MGRTILHTVDVSMGTLYQTDKGNLYLSSLYLLNDWFRFQLSGDFKKINQFSPLLEEKAIEVKCIIGIGIIKLSDVEILKRNCRRIVLYMISVFVKY
jgi:hypothetical protein